MQTNQQKTSTFQKLAFPLLIILLMIYLIAWSLDSYQSSNGGNIEGFICFIFSSGYTLKIFLKIITFQFSYTHELWVGLSHLSNYTYWIALYYLFRYRDYWKSSQYLFLSVLFTAPISIVYKDDWLVGFYVWYLSMAFSFFICYLYHIIYPKPLTPDMIALISQSTTTNHQFEEIEKS
jgi:hypothetical protein